MKAIFLKDITVDFVDRFNEIGDEVFHKNDCVDVTEVIQLSNRFTSLVLSSGTTLIAVRNDSFKLENDEA